MREIKLRTWLGKRFWFFDLTSGFNAENNDVCNIPEQYTGLKDNNGKEIYESDIITFGNSDTLHKIVFSKKGYWLAENITPNDYHYIGRAMYCDDVWDIVIHGNIHENGDLLK